MNPILDACLRSWPWDPWLTGGLTLTAVVYFRGWRYLRRRDEQRWHAGQLTAFLGGLAAIFLALASPIEPFSFFFLQVHMLQHLLLMMLAPPLLWLGAPFMPLLRGLPRPIRVHWAGPLLRSKSLRRAFTWLTRPAPACLLFIAMTWVWHVPQLYDLALRSDACHYLQHACFLGSALLFWYPVVRPYPSRPRWSLWQLVPMLLAADVQNTVLSALLTFSSRVVYSHYADVPRLGDMTALEDQAAAGVLMWVPGSIAFLLPLFWIGLRLLSKPEDIVSGGDSRAGSVSDVTTLELARRPSSLTLPALGSSVKGRDRGASRVALTVVSATPDLLSAPLLGRFLRWRHARLCLQAPLLILAAIIVVDGLTGPEVGAMNLAGVLPWIHWRGVVVLALLALGNVFCMACPFTLPRNLARRWTPVGRAWPKMLRNKWLAVGLVVVFLWAYEVFALWDSPWLTAWIILAYFAVAFAIDRVFRGASFCKYVCPIGQFHFVQSLVSPLEVKVRDPAICETCQTKDCIRGRDGIPGCELRLYQPRKSSNMDCTFCLDCVHACPHDNIGVVATMPGAELRRDSHRSGVGRWSKRPDLAALVVVLVFGAFVNAALMTGPIVAATDRWTELLGLTSPVWVTTVISLIALVAVPLFVMGSAAALSRHWGGSNDAWTETASRFAYALVPLGFGMWLAHYSFHFLTSYASLIPTTQRFVADWGGSFLGNPEWACACCLPAANWLLRLEIVFLDVGLLLSLYTGYRIAQSQSRRPLAAFAPWALVIALLFAVGIWIVFQPMQMRGTLGMAG